VRFVLLLAFLFVALPEFGAENLLIIDVYARVVPQSETKPIPDPFIAAILRGELKTAAPGVQKLQGKVFQMKPVSHDFEAVLAGVDGQRVELSFTAALLPSGACAVTNFQLGAASASQQGALLPSNSSQTMSRGGFTLQPGQKISQSVSAQFGNGTIIYYLVFSAAKGVVD
jgi:hypothetical protein